MSPRHSPPAHLRTEGTPDLAARQEAIARAGALLATYEQGRPVQEALDALAAAGRAKKATAGPAAEVKGAA